MIPINKYIRELGYSEKSYPFNEQTPSQEDGFYCEDFYNLDTTLALIIYSYLCYFREHIAKGICPGCFAYGKSGERNDEEGIKKWLETLDDMILGFKIFLKEGMNSKTEDKKMKFGMRQFIKYFGCLWY